MKIGDQVFRAVLDTGATLSIVARRLPKTYRKTKTVAIRVGDGRTIHSLGGVDVTICVGDETVTQHCRVLDTDAFDIVIGTNFLMTRSRGGPATGRCGGHTQVSRQAKHYAHKGINALSCDKAFQNPCHSAKRERKYVQQHIRICTHGVKTGLG